MPARPPHSLPAEIYALVDGTPGTVLLEGGEPRKSDGMEEPWTRLFTAPLRICLAYDTSEVPALFAEIERAVASGHSAAGFFSYECGACFEPKVGTRSGPIGTPLAWFGIYERAHIFDHETGLFAVGSPAGMRVATRQSLAFDPDTEFALSEPDYFSHIEAIHEWIRSGDVYQLNLTAPLRIRVRGSAAGLYARLRERQPARYGAFLHWREDRRILSFSPELFFRVDQNRSTEEVARRIVTRPMKGTAPRGKTTAEDRILAEWLRNDAKNRSENLMIVDLVRNDLGRVARFGTVRAEELFSVERLPTLWQMTSTVSAELRKEVGFEDIFRALFPCGSITGAPKVRAMQLIGELEDEPRGVYTGAIGYFSPRETIFNVAIRTLALEGEKGGSRGTMGVGSGIVIDSDAASEYRECLLKAEFLSQSKPWQRKNFSLIETMLWKCGFPLMEMHLDRLADSVEHFDFRCDRQEVKTALEAYARSFAEGSEQRVRLLLARDGAMQITREELGESSAVQQISQSAGRVCIAAERTDPADPMLYHKTTHRPLYGPAFEAALKHHFADVLFFNLRGELTEGAISNVFIEKEGCWFTPPIDCGLLAGVYRRYLLTTRSNIEERVLYEQDLRAADAVYLCNAVRGLRRVEIAWRSAHASDLA